MRPSFRILGVALLLSTSLTLVQSDSSAQSRYATKSAQSYNTAQPKTLNAGHYAVPQIGRYNPYPVTGPQKKYGGLMGHLKGQTPKTRRGAPSYNSKPSYNSGPSINQRQAMARYPQHFTVQPPLFQQWVDWEPQYLIQPDDQLDIVVSSAPELSRTLTVGPDGRVVMPMSEPVMAAGRSFVQLQSLLKAELAKQLRDPTVAVTPRAYAPQQIFVGGEVGQPGTYTIPGRIGALEALFMAGGMTGTAKTSKVAILRRAPNGGMMMRVVDIRGGMRNISQYNDNRQLRRGDIVFVPKSTLAEVGTFMQNFRNALPVDFNLSYQFGQNGGGTTVVSP